MERERKIGVGRIFRRPVRQLKRPLVWVSITSGIVVVVGIVAGVLAIQAIDRDNDIASISLPTPRALQAVTVHGSPILALRQKSNSHSPLLLFLPATGATTTLYSSFERTAADSGYHVLALPYANLRTERSICQANLSCYGQVRAEQLTGTPSRYLPPQARTTSLQVTLPFAIKQLSRKDPSGQWGEYLTGGKIDWADIVVAGHSQGGGVAAYIAHQYAVKGVIMFSSPNDVVPFTNTPATWLKGHSATPVDRYYGFMDTHDFYASSTRTAWRTMLPGVTVVKADNMNNLSGRLLSTSTAHFPDRLTAHFAVARDTTYTPVWQYLLQKNL